MTLLAVRGGALGDFVLTVPALQALRRQADRLVLVCQPRFAEPWPDLADDILDLDRAHWLFGVGSPPAGVERAVGWTEAMVQNLRALGIREVRGGSPHPPPGIHASDHLWAQAGLLGRCPPPAVHPTEGAMSGAAARIEPGRTVVLAPGAGAVGRRWPAMAAVARQLRAVGTPFAWLMGRDEGLAGERAEGPVLPPLGLPELVGLARCCRAWVGNDCGTTHLAAAAGAAVVVMFGPSDPVQWAPRPPAGGVVHVRPFTSDPAQIAALAADPRAGGA